MARVRQELPRQVILRQRPLARNRTRSHNGVKMDSKSTDVPNVATFALNHNSFSVRSFCQTRHIIGVSVFNFECRRSNSISLHFCHSPIS